MSSEHPPNSPITLAESPAERAVSDVSIEKELDAFEIPTPATPVITASEMEPETAWAPGEEVTYTFHVPVADDPDVEFQVFREGEAPPKRKAPDTACIAKIRVSCRGEEEFQPSVRCLGRPAQDPAEEALLFWTVVHWCRARGIPGVSKEFFHYKGTPFRLGGLYQYAGFAHQEREMMYTEYGERPIDEGDELESLRPDGLPPIETASEEGPGSVGTSESTNHASAIISSLKENAEGDND